MKKYPKTHNNMCGTKHSQYATLVYRVKANKDNRVKANKDNKSEEHSCKHGLTAGVCTCVYVCMCVCDRQMLFVCTYSTLSQSPPACLVCNMYSSTLITDQYIDLHKEEPPFLPSSSCILLYPSCILLYQGLSTQRYTDKSNGNIVVYSWVEHSFISFVVHLPKFLVLLPLLGQLFVLVRQFSCLEA